MKHVVVIGSGLGGLSCGAILAKNGYKVTILEQSARPGGCLQCFYRDGAKFETGMHYIGSADEGQILHKLMKYLEIDDVELSRLDAEGYDVISFNGDHYRFANGRERFIATLAAEFPDQRDNLHAYFDTIEKISKASSLHSLRTAESDASVSTEFQTRSMNEVLDSLISNPTLRNVLAGNQPLYAAEKDKTPFSVHAFIMDFYNQSAFRVVGGSDMISNGLMRTLGRYGTEVLCNRKVSRILCDETRATCVETINGERYEADYVISAIHPARTMELLDTKLIRPAFKNRMKSIPNTVGGFALYLKFKPGMVPYKNYNFFSYGSDTPWGCENYTDADWPKGYVYMHMCHKRNPDFALSGEVLTYMLFADVEKWLGTKVGQRGEEYLAFKRERAEKLLDSMERDFPNIRECIESYTTSTPLTYLDYTGTSDGSMYGVARDYRNMAECRVPHRTRIPNLLFTGQNINSHGMLGVLVGSIVTASAFLPAEEIYQQIQNSEGSSPDSSAYTDQ